MFIDRSGIMVCKNNLMGECCNRADNFFELLGVKCYILLHDN